jgi:hypothetical protein
MQMEMHKDDVYRLIDPAPPGPTIGERNVRLVRMPVHHRVDFYDKSGRLNALIILVPVLYAFIRIQLGQPLSSWFWWITLGTVVFALFARRPAYLRLGAAGISFPEKKSPDFAWDEMREARARDEGIDILMQDGQHITISFTKMRRADVMRIKRLIKAQFEAIAERAQAAEEEAARLDEAGT